MDVVDMVKKSSSPAPTLKDIDEILLDLARLEDQAFRELVDEVHGPDGFSRTKERLDALAKKLGCKNPSDVYGILSVGEFLYSTFEQVRTDSEDVGDQMKSLLASFLEEKYSKEIEALIPRLTKLIESNPNIDKIRKIRRLRTGLIPNGRNFESFVDLRPDFDPDKTEIQSLVPIVIFRISTDATDSREKSIVFQLSPDTLEELSEAVSNAEKKLEALKTDTRVSTLLVTEPEQ